MRIKQPMVLAVDVDGTLVCDGKVNKAVVDYCREMKAKGWTLILWSSGGQIHACGVAEDTGLTDLFDIIISKPGMILDDRGWSWTRFSPVVDGVVDVHEYKRPV
jgi:hydroxymethylpyrimidine pyrophosphatase-like HAD family hydrolase